MPYKDPPKTGRERGRPAVSEDERRERLAAKRPWATYLGGSWSREQPKRPGLYPIASRTGKFMGYREFVDVRGKIKDALAGPNEPGWCGWIWTVALPEPPREPADWYAAVPDLAGIESSEEIEAKQEVEA